MSILFPLKPPEPDIDKYYTMPKPTTGKPITEPYALPMTKSVPVKPSSRPVIKKSIEGPEASMWSKAGAEPPNPLQKFIEGNNSINPNIAEIKLEKERDSLNSLKQVEGYSIPTKINMSGLKDRKSVEEVQSILKAAGHDLGNYGVRKDGIDGVIGKKTTQAINDYNNKVSSTQSEIEFNPEERQNPKLNVGKDVTSYVPEKQCAAYVANELYRVSNTTVPVTTFLERTGLGGNAWDAANEILSKGGQYVYNERDSIDRKSIAPKIGDVVNMFTGGGSHYQKDADAAAGGGKNSGYTHMGFISKVYTDGTYDIDHNVHKKDAFGNWVGHASVTHVGKDPKTNVISHITDTGNRIGKIIRPSYSNLEGRKTVYDSAIKLDESTATPSSKTTTAFFNTNKEKIARHFKLDEDENMALSKLALGIIDQETKGTPSTKLKIKELISTAGKQLLAAGNPSTYTAKSTPLKYGENIEASKGLARIKYQMNFTPEQVEYLQKTFGVKDKTSPEGSLLFTMSLLSDHYNRFRSKGMSKDEAMYRAVAQHNSPSKAKSIGKFSKGDTDYASNYDLDYVNKVLSHSLKYTASKSGTPVGTIADRLASNQKVMHNTAKIPSIKKSIMSRSTGGLLYK